jgi:hypothetical protein
MEQQLGPLVPAQPPRAAQLCQSSALQTTWQMEEPKSEKIVRGSEPELEEEEEEENLG